MIEVKQYSQSPVYEKRETVGVTAQEGFKREVSEFIHKFEQIKTIVRSTLEEHPRARNEDLYLILKTWETVFHIDLKVLWENYDNLFIPESLRRARQEIQAGGELLPTDETVSKRRGLQSKIMKVGFSKEKAEKFKDEIYEVK